MVFLGATWALCKHLDSFRRTVLPRLIGLFASTKMNPYRESSISIPSLGKEELEKDIFDAKALELPILCYLFVHTVLETMSVSVCFCCPRDHICLSLLSQRLFLCLSVNAVQETLSVSVLLSQSLSVCLSLLSQRLCLYSSQSHI